MANYYTPNKDEWKALADIDYFGMFVKAYIPFNAWMNVSYPQFDSDRARINAIKRDPNLFRDKIYALLDSDSQVGANFRNTIGELHNLLENHYIHNQDRRITFTEIVLGRNPVNLKEDSHRGIGFRVQYGNGGTSTQTDSLIKHRNNAPIFRLSQPDYDIAALKVNPNFIALPEEYRGRLVQCYEAVKPIITKNLLTGFNPNDETQYYKMGSFMFVRDKESIAKGLIEILYNMRNSLFHGELIPNKEANKIYGAAYTILRELIEAL